MTDIDCASAGVAIGAFEITNVGVGTLMGEQFRNSSLGGAILTTAVFSVAALTYYYSSRYHAREKKLAPAQEKS